MSIGSVSMSAAQLEIVRGIVRRFLGGFEVFLFGSRATGRARPYSDLDLAVRGPAPMGLALQAEVQEAFDESDLPFRVDIVDWALVSDTFRRIIERSSTRFEPWQPEPDGPR